MGNQNVQILLKYIDYHNKKILFLLCILVRISVSGQTINYTPSSDIIANPERGLQKYSISADNYATTVGANNLPLATLNSWKNGSDKITVVYRCFLLSAFMNSSINATYLDNIQADFDHIRTAGLKVIVRFSYSNTEGSIPQQPSKTMIFAHINQLSPLLNSNKDVIFSLQAGFIGTYGEWYYTNSDEFGTSGTISPTQWANRKEVLDAMLSATPAEIPIQVRSVGIKTTLYGTDQLNTATAFQGTANARIGFYNDAFLNKWGDMGTYSSGECDNPVGTVEYDYLSNETKYLPMSGETNGLNDCDGGFRTTGSNAIYEMGLTNWTTLNRDYHLGFWNQVMASGNYNDIVKNLGYRFVLNSSSITSSGSGFDLVLNITNAGFTTPFKQRDIYLVLKNITTNSLTTYLINTDVRNWETSVQINQIFDPGLTGTFQLYLWLPDKDPGLATIPGYSIRFANNDTWQPSTGYNDLLQTVTLNALGVLESFEEHLPIYPNPSSDHITIPWLGSQNKGIRIYNALGQLAKQANISNNNRIDVSDLSSGIYFIRLNDFDSPTLKFTKR